MKCISINEPICRYCYENNDKDLLITCNCTTPVHKECLKEWILKRPFNRGQERTKENLEKCEICNSKYLIPIEEFLDKKDKYEIIFKLLITIIVILLVAIVIIVIISYEQSMQNIDVPNQN